MGSKHELHLLVVTIIKEKRSFTHEDVLPRIVASLEVEPVLPQISGNGAVRLDVRKVGVMRAWVARKT